ncbi:probable translation initiation factor eIF-2B subunit epsilon [Zingiber officinale]|uniref:probable translation initiation factor eIF-2B subunit epsilon n=1 Tax=Zingiber officinale TaxID=94328 RepID=UPI001C4DB796|nr:probable translation initiation factor eIF-2B subunit epsilon [Zingiber officinale]
MAQKKGQRGATSVAADDSEVVARIPLQAVLLADSFNLKFRPITLERPKVLLPLVNVPMIEYTLAWLDSVGVEEVFVFCCSHSQQVKDYLKESEWMKPSSRFSITTVESHDAISAGDALRVIYEKSVIRGDFVLISGDTISNMNLTQALQEHKERRKKDPLAVMTMIIKHSKPSNLTHQTRLGTDELLMAIDPQTKELMFYEDKVNPSIISIDKELLANNTWVYLHNNKQDCYIDICSPEVLSLFMDNFDYQHLRRHFVKGLLVDDIMGYKIFTHEIHSSYAARIDNFRSYGTISKDILQRWAYPLVPNFQYFGISSKVKLDRQGVYSAPDVVQSRSARIGATTLIGSGTTIGNHTGISNSVVGRGCTIGNNVCIDGCYIWDNVIIEDGCRLNHAIVCDGVHLSAGVVLEPGVILSFKVEVGRLITIPAYSKVSLRPQPSVQDSDEELEYADASSAVIESPSITSMVSNRNAESSPDYSAHEVGISGVGYIWSTNEGEHEEEWRHSIAPIPEAKLIELSHAYLEEPDVAYLDVNDFLVSGEVKPDSESIGFDDGDGGDYGDSADFDKEVEATFHRALTGVNQETVILEINSLRLSCNKSHADCAGALFFSMMELGLEAPRSSNSELYQNIAKEINKWKDLLKHYLKSVDEEIEVILKFEEICLETATELAPLFSIILSYLYEKDILSEDAILSWASEKEGADESDKIFVKQSESFITWLKEASEEEDEDNGDE